MNLKELTTKHLCELRLEAAQEVRRLADRSNDSEHKWTDDDEKAWRKANDRFEEIDREARARELDRQMSWAPPEPTHQRESAGFPYERQAPPRDGGLILRGADGREVRALEPGESIARAEPQEDREEALVRFGNCLRAALTGDMGSLSPAERSALMGGVDSQGGYLLTPKLSATVIDLARSASVCMGAGARTIPMDSPELHLVGVAQDPTSQWRPEGVAVKASEAYFGRITLRARTLAAIVPVSIELLEDAANVASVLEAIIRRSMALALDKACLFGAGAESEPLGVKNYPDVNAQTSVGTPTDWSDVSAAVKSILDANYDGGPGELAWISNPREGATYEGLLDTTNQPLQPTPWAAALRRMFTTSIAVDEGAGSNESSMYVGHFPQMVIGMRRRLNIRVLQEGTIEDLAAQTHNATSELKKLVVAYLRADVALLRPTWFTVLSGVTAA